VGAFGEKLRSQREQRGLTLDAISTTTKISPRMLRAIEDEHFDQLPGGVFNKGFVRAYARQVGLDEEEAVSDYLAALRESQIQSQAILPSFRNPGGASTTDRVTPEPANRHSSGEAERERFSHLRDSTSDSGYVADIPAPVKHDVSGRDRRLEERRREERRRESSRNEDQPGGLEERLAGRVHADESDLGEGQAEGHPVEEEEHAPLSFLNLTSEPSSARRAADYNAEQISASDSTNPVPWGKLAAALLLITLTLALWGYRRHRQLASTSSQPPIPSQPDTAPAAAPPDLSKKPAATASAVTPIAEPINTKSAAASVVPAARPMSVSTAAPAATTLARPVAKIAVPKAPARFTLVIRADQTSWVAISADGQPVAQETLIAPANTSVRASHEIVVKAGNAAGISFMLNGKEIAVHGNPGEVRTFTFDAGGMSANSAGQTASTAR
jgi:cytoskeletal protein RodZ